MVCFVAAALLVGKRYTFAAYLPDANDHCSCENVALCVLEALLPANTSVYPGASPSPAALVGCRGYSRNLPPTYPSPFPPTLPSHQPFPPTLPTLPTHRPQFACACVLSCGHACVLASRAPHAAHTQSQSDEDGHGFCDLKNPARIRKLARYVPPPPKPTRDAGNARDAGKPACW